MKNLFKLILILTFCTLSLAQVKIFRNLTIEDGLAQSYVNAIYQDSKGYMWFGTMHGLTRWDGIYYRNYDLIDGLIGTDVKIISEDKKGNVIIGTDLGMSLYKNYKLTNIEFDERVPSKDIYSLYTNKKDETYVGLNKGLIKLVNYKVKNIFTDSLVSGKRVYALAGNDQGVVYLAVTGVGLIKLENEKLELLSDSKEFEVIWGNAFINSKDELIVNTRSGFAVYKEGNIKFVDVKKNNSKLRIRKIFPGDFDQVFLTTNQGVFIYDKGEIEVIDYKNGLPGNNAASIWRDKSGVYYFGIQAEGVALYDGGRIFSLNKKTGFTSNRIYGITQGYDNKMFISSIGGGLQVYDGERIQILSKSSGFPTNNVNDVTSYDDESIIAATDVGLIHWGKKGLIKILNRKSGLESNFIRTVDVAEDKTIYAVSNAGLYEIKGKQIKLWRVNKDIPADRILHMSKLMDGTILLGTENSGIVKISGDSVSTITKQNGLADNKVLCTYQRKDGTILAGTQGGLTVIKDNKFKVFNTLNGLTDNTIYCIDEDNNGQIYLTTNRGMDIVNFINDEIQVRNISMKNGLAGNECNVRGLCKDSKGRMWVGTLKGVSCYDPSKDNLAKNPPDIKLTSVRLYDKIVEDFYQNRDLIFKHNENYLRFRFLGFNLTSPEQVKYQYRLTNVDPEWVESDVRFARYANLGNGDYKFEVRAKNEGGNWGNITSVSFTILAPFYLSWWFISLSVSIIAGTIILFITMRVRQVIQFERLRTKLSADLHDNVGAGLTEISILSEVIALAKERNNEDVTRNLNLISRTARQLVDSMSDIVWLVNPKRDSLYDLIIRLEETYCEIFNSKGISFQSKNLISLQTISLPMEYRQHLYLIFKEGINNSLKYSSCNKIFLDANVEGKKLEMRLSDDGRGFDTNKKSSGEGLKNMYERTKLINGKLNIYSDIGEGTRISFEGKITG